MKTALFLVKKGGFFKVQRAEKSLFFVRLLGQ